MRSVILSGCDEIKKNLNYNSLRDTGLLISPRILRQGLSASKKKGKKDKLPGCRLTVALYRPLTLAESPDSSESHECPGEWRDLRH